jgi:tetratricopeptide (TPR) repeat protein
MGSTAPRPVAASTVNRADHLIAIGRAEEARALLLGDPDTARSPDALVTLSHAYDKLGRYQDALGAAQAATALAPESASACLMMAVALMKLDRPVDAFEPARRGLQLAPQHYGAHQIMARVLSDLGRFEPAQHHVDQVLALDPDGTSGWVTLCRLRLAQRQWAEAEEAARRALRADPGSDEAKLLLSVAQASAGGSAKRNEAMETLIASLRTNPDQAHVKDLLIELVKPTGMPIPWVVATLLIVAGGGGIVLVAWAMWVWGRWRRTPPDVRRLVWTDRRARWRITLGLAVAAVVCVGFTIATVLAVADLRREGCLFDCPEPADSTSVGLDLDPALDPPELDEPDPGG